MSRFLTVLILALLLTIIPPDADSQQKRKTSSRPKTEQPANKKGAAKGSGSKSSGAKSSTSKSTDSKSTGKKTAGKSTPPRSAKDVRRDKVRTESEMKETGRKIKLNAEQTARKLSQLNLVEGEIEECNGRIAILSHRLDSLNLCIGSLNDSVAALDKHLQQITATYKTALRRSQGRRGNLSVLAFIFSSDSFTQAYHRARYLRRFARWREKRAGEIAAAKDILDQKRKRLETVIAEASKSKEALSSEHTTLVRRKSETSALVDELQSQGAALKDVMARQRAQAQALDRELDNIIAREAARQEAERKEAARRAEEAKRRAAEAEAARKAEAERAEAARKAAEAEAEAARKAAAAEKARKDAEAEAARKEAEAEKARQAAQADAARKAEAERARKEAAEAKEAARKAQEAAKKAEKERKAAEEKKRKEDARAKAKPVKHGQKPTPAADAPSKTPVADPSGDSKVIGATDFATLKGSLAAPVAGRYTIVKHFGRQKHPTLPHVETDNAGIDIETAKKAAVRAVSGGEVSAVFRPDGYNVVVVIRHGAYMTVYANLGSVNVSAGQTVTAGQTIGQVYSDPNDNGRSVLHFEVRNGRQKENPEAWLRK